MQEHLLAMAMVLGVYKPSLMDIQGASSTSAHPRL
jgi:hypothetical protein